MAVSTLADHLAALGWSSSVAVPADLHRLLAALEATWPAGPGTTNAQVATACALPGFATLSLDPGTTVLVTLSQPAGHGFRADIALDGAGITLPGLTSGTPQSAGAQTWVQPTGTPVRAAVNAVVRVEGAPGELAGMSLLTNGPATITPAHMLLPGESFGLHLPTGITLSAAGLSISDAQLFLPRAVPYVGGATVPFDLSIGTPTGVDGRAEVDIAAVDGRPRLRGAVEWHDAAAASLADCVPTLVDVSAEFAIHGTTTPTLGNISPVTVSAGDPLRLRARFARDPHATGQPQRFDVAVLGEERDGLLRVDDRVFATAAAFASALLADTDASSAPSGDSSSARLDQLLVVAAALSHFCTSGKVVVHGVSAEGTADSGKLVLEVDYSVDIALSSFGFAGLTIGMSAPMRVRHRAVRLEIDPAAAGLAKFHLSYARARMDVEDPGRWVVPGAPFEVTGNRAGHGSTWFEVDLRFTVDLGPVKVSGATVRATFDGATPTVSLRGLDAALDIPGVISGTGGLELTGSGFAAALAVKVVPLNLDASAFLDTTAAGTKIVIVIGVDLPGAIPLGPTGLGLYSVGGMFGFNARPTPPGPGQDPVEYRLGWTTSMTEFNPGDLMFGLAAVVGTLPDMGTTFSAAARILLTVPDLAFQAGLRATFLSERVRLSTADTPLGSGAITGVLVCDARGVLIGLRGTYDLSPLLLVTVPVDAVFPAGSDPWYIHIGSDGANQRKPGPVQAKVLPDLLDLGAEAYLMVRSAGIADVGGQSDFDLNGFSVAFGAGFRAVYGAGLIWLELAADAQFGIGTAPLVVRGRGSLAGALHLGPVSVGASAKIDAQVGPGSTRWAKFRVCGEVDLFFFELSGCVDITIGAEDLGVPPPDRWPLPEMALCDHAYRQTADAVAGGAAPADVPCVWPDAIPLLKFPVLPGPAGFASTQFAGALLAGSAWQSTNPAVATSTGRTGADDLSYEFALTGLRLLKADGTEVAGELDAAWQTPKLASGAAAGGMSGELALLTWQTALWTARLADGGTSRPVDPLDEIAHGCQADPRAQSGWALGVGATALGERWRMPPEGSPSDALASRFWVDVEARHRERPLHPPLADVSPGLGYLPGGAVVFPAPLRAGPRTFAGALAVPALVGPSAWEPDLGGVRTTLTVVSDRIAPELLVVRVDDQHIDEIKPSGGGQWHPAEAVPGGDGTTVLVFRCEAATPTDLVSMEYSVGARLAVLGLSGVSDSAVAAAQAAAAAAQAATATKAMVLGKSKAARRTLLEPGTTYAVEVTLSCQGKRTRDGTVVGQANFGPETVRHWFRTAPVPDDEPPVATLVARMRTHDRFDVSYLERYLLGYAPIDRAAHFFPDDPIGAHFAVDHVSALAAKYDRKVTLALRRTDLPPGSGSAELVLLPAVWAALAAEAKGMSAIDDRLRDLDARDLIRCPVPHLGSTFGAPAVLEPSASYDLAVQVPPTGEPHGPALTGVAFRTSRYRNPRDQLADLGFSAGGMAGGLPVTVPAALTGGEDGDAAFAALFGQLGLTPWQHPPRGRGSLLWSRDGGPWLLAGVLLESPEPLERAGRMRLGALECMGVPFDVVQRNAASTSVLYLTRTPVRPRRRRFGFVWRDPSLSLAVAEHGTSFTVRAAVPTAPAFAEELP